MSAQIDPKFKPNFKEVTDGLLFPEGPIAMPDGSVIVVEIAGGRLTRVSQNGEKSLVADTQGGPNGAAVGPDGRIYVCNNGGIPKEYARDHLGIEGDGLVAERIQSCLQVVDPATGKVETLHTESEGWAFNSLNDIVFDAHGGCYFTDLGLKGFKRTNRGRVMYAKADGSLVKNVIAPIDAPNGVGLSPDGKSLYVSQTDAGKCWAFDITEPGSVKIENEAGWGARLICTLPRIQEFDSMAVDSEGNVCVGTLIEGGITVIRPDGSSWWKLDGPDRMVTNICFGGSDLKTAYITCSTTGKLLSFDWDVPGTPLNYLNT